MFQEMRRSERALTKEETADIFQCGQYGILSTVGEDGYPYGVPVNYVFDDQRIYIHGAPAGHKIANTSFCSKVSFCVVGHTKPLPEKLSTLYESAIAFGKIRICEGKEKEDSLLKLLNKYVPKNLQAGHRFTDDVIDRVEVLCIDVEHITGKARRQ